MKKILVTGGAGFIGSHLCESLLEKNYKVIALDNLFSGSLDNIKKFSNNKNFKFVKGDVRNKTLLRKLINDVDKIYHLAAIVGVSVVVENPIENINVNIDGIRNVAEIALELNKKVLFTSSSEVYGKNTNTPLKENISESIFGSTSISRWSYGMAKALGEEYLYGLKEKGMKFAIVRYFNCYGPRGINKRYKNVIPKFIEQSLKNEPITIFGSGKETRCYCYVKDTVKGTILAMENINEDVVNIGSNKETSIENLAKKIIDLTKSKSKIIKIEEKKVFKREYESSTKRVPAISKAKKSMAFKPEVTLNEGLKETINWTKEELNIS